MHNRILVIDDDAATRSLLTAILERGGYAAHACMNGKEGIAAFRTSPFDLVITDISMPVINGIEVITLIRQESPTVPIIAMSGADRSESFLNMADYYTADFTVLKPFTAKQIIGAVRGALER
jgi:CheY-like chemotaxis protein